MDISDDEDDDLSLKSVKSIDSGDGHYETEEKADVISMKKLTDDGSHLDKIKDEKRVSLNRIQRFAGIELMGIHLKYDQRVIIYR